MNRTTTYMETILSTSVYGALATQSFHLFNIIALIFNAKLRRQNVNFLLLNLSLSDMLLVVHFRLMLFFRLATYQFPVLVSRMFHLASILLTCSITLDRYLKVGLGAIVILHKRRGRGSTGCVTPYSWFLNLHLKLRYMGRVPVIFFPKFALSNISMAPYMCICCLKKPI